MQDAILYFSFATLVIIGYILVIMIPFYIHNHTKISFKLYKKWFFLSQGTALIIALYLMTTERNLVPIIGYIVLIITSVFSMMAMGIEFVIPPNERSQRGKKLLRVVHWVFYCAVFLTLVWTLVWWKEIFR
jgi:hypothetical protein